MNIDWEPDTQDLIDIAGLEVTPAKLNVAVRQWLRQLLRHRDYLEKVKADPERREKFEEKRKEYSRQYRRHGLKGHKRDAEDFTEREKHTRKIPLLKPIPEDDMYFRMQKLLREEKEKKKSAEQSDDILFLGKM